MMDEADRASFRLWKYIRQFIPNGDGMAVILREEYGPVFVKLKIAEKKLGHLQALTQLAYDDDCIIHTSACVRREHGVCTCSGGKLAAIIKESPQ